MSSRKDVKCPGFTNVFEPRGKACIGNGVRHFEAKRCLLCSAEARKTRPAPAERLAPAQNVAQDREKQRAASHLRGVSAKYAEALKTIERQEKELAIVHQLEEGLDTYTIPQTTAGGGNEGTVVLVASDWHIEETVGAEIGGLNVFTPSIARQRAERFFQKGLLLTRLLQKDITINTLVLPLLGDFISNDIHEEFPEVNSLQPMHAIVEAQNLIASGIEFLLNNSKLNIVIPCHSGNHARTTRTTRFGTENGHSLEYLMYRYLAAYFRSSKRVTFQIAEGMHSYIQVYNTTIRFQHGHAIKYGGGVGGIYIPVNKAIGQWNKARHADLDVFGHFHQTRDGGNFLCNGSLIGYNSFALSIKADYEPPRQLLFLLDRKRGRTCTWPILLNEGK